MSNWKNLFIRSVSVIEEKWDELSANLSHRLGLNDPLQIVPYRSYGTANRLYIKGRVLEDKKITSAGDKDTILNNLLNMYKRFESDEIPGAQLKVVLADEEHLVTSDEEGYFVFDLVLKTPIINENLWHLVPLQVESSPVAFDLHMSVDAEVMISSGRCRIWNYQRY